jgi:NAD(P)-dependent dehydrogenase (short-subunit alcohol dehydrogenase family)
MTTLDGQVAIVTGGARGQGRAHAVALASLTGVFHAMRAVVPHMRTRGRGRIVVISSLGGRTGLPGISHYSAAKWGVIGLAKSLALEVAAEGITVNVVAPTTVRTPMVVNEQTLGLSGGRGAGGRAPGHRAGQHHRHGHRDRPRPVRADALNATGQKAR